MQTTSLRKNCSFKNNNTNRQNSIFYARTTRNKRSRIDCHICSRFCFFLTGQTNPPTMPSQPPNQAEPSSPLPKPPSKARQTQPPKASPTSLSRSQNNQTSQPTQGPQGPTTSTQPSNPSHRPKQILPPNQPGLSSSKPLPIKNPIRQVPEIPWRPYHQVKTRSAVSHSLTNDSNRHQPMDLKPAIQIPRANHHPKSHSLITLDFHP